MNEFHQARNKTDGGKTMKAKAITFIVMVCMLLVGAVALPIGDAQALPKAPKPKPINVNGIVGQNLGIDLYNGCDGARRYLFDNALLDNTEYHLNYQTCKVEQKMTTTKTYPCGRMITRVVNGEKTKVHKNICTKQVKMWVEVN